MRHFGTMAGAVVPASTALLWGSWVGEDNIRHYEFVNGVLKLSVVDDAGSATGTLTWRKYE